MWPNSISHQAKHYFTLGTVVASTVLPSMVGTTWAILRKWQPGWFSSAGWPFLLSFVAVYFIAWVIPEPSDYEDAGKLRLTLHEFVFGFFNSITLGVTVVGVTRWLESP